jgi:hypothetical protein
LEEAEANERKAKRERDLQEMGKTGKAPPAKKSRASPKVKVEPAGKASPKKKKGGDDDEDYVDKGDKDDDEVIVLDGAEVEDENYSAQLDKTLAEISIKASRGDYYLSELGGFESDFRKKDDDDDLGDGDAGGSRGVASSSSKADDDELDDEYYEAQVVLEEEARLEAQARDALIPTHARSTQAMLSKNRMNNLLADSDDE